MDKKPTKASELQKLRELVKKSKISKKTKRTHKIQVVSILLVLFITIVSFTYKQMVSNPLDPESTEEISVIIKKAQSVKDLGSILEEKELISSPTIFYMYARFNGLGENIVAGRFALSPSMTIPQIIETISDAKNSEAVITIQESLRVADIDERLAEMELLRPEDFEKAVASFSLEDYEYYPFLDKDFLTSPVTNPNGNTILLSYPLEGYLYPDTYFLDPGSFKPETLIYKALNNFKFKTEEIITEITASKYTLHEILTMASILEKEVRSADDRSLVAGILWKRLENGWRLDADATLLYTKDNNKITTEDLNSDNPYNTRKYKGLPPGPIGNPSLPYIIAALRPTSSQYWFYLTDEDGKVIYAKTNEEHNLNKARFL